MRDKVEEPSAAKLPARTPEGFTDQVTKEGGHAFATGDPTGTRPQHRMDRADGHQGGGHRALLPLRRSSAAPRSTSPLASSTLKPWPAALRSSPPPPEASSKSSSKTKPATSFPFEPHPETTFPVKPRPVRPRPRRPLSQPFSLNDPDKGKAASAKPDANASKPTFSWTAIADQTIALYQRLLETKQA